MAFKDILWYKGMMALNKPKKISIGTPFEFGEHRFHFGREVIDTRYQLAREEKDDRFFFREDGSWLGNFYNKGASYKPITELRREWGLE